MKTQDKGAPECGERLGRVVGERNWNSFFPTGPPEEQRLYQTKGGKVAKHILMQELRRDTNAPTKKKKSSKSGRVRQSLKERARNESQRERKKEISNSP